MIHLGQGNRSFLATATRSLLALFLLSCFPVAVLGHAKLIRSQPKAKETLSQAPKFVELWFSEALEAGLNSIEVKNQQGTRVDRGEVTLSEGNTKAQIELGELSPGVYTVVWKSLSADQHAIRGRFSFSVAAQAAPPTSGTPGTSQTATSTPMPAMSPEEEDQGEQISWSQTLVRWLSYVAMMMLFGGFALRSLVLVPSFRRALEGVDKTQARVASERRVLTLAWASVIILAVTSLAALVMQASAVFDKSLGESFSPSLLARVLATGYGGSWSLQIISVGAIGIILLLLTRRTKRHPTREHSGLWWAGLVASSALLVAPSWTGHAVASVNDFRLAVFSDWLHLLAGGFWVGGLFHMALTLPSALASIAKPRRTIALYYLIRLFTRIAMPSVLLLVLAGLYNTWAHVPRLQALWSTPYGKALSVKLLIVGLMLLLGAFNNFHFGKRAARLVEAQKAEPDAGGHPKLERGFRRSVALEAGLGVAVLLVTAVLVFMTPARNHPAMTDAETGQPITQQK
jgi:copper transport protein